MREKGPTPRPMADGNLRQGRLLHQSRRRVWVAHRGPPERFDALFYAIGFALFTLVWRVQDLVTILGKLKPGVVAVTLLVLVYAVDRDPRRRMSAILRRPIAIMLLLILAMMLVSLTTALYKGLAFRFITEDYLPNLVTALIVAASVRDLRDVERLLGIQILGCLFFAGFVLLRFHVQPNGRLGSLVYYDANGLGMILVVTLPFVVYAWRRARTTLLRAAAIGVMGVYVLALVKSGSRGAFLGLVGVSIVLLVTFRAIPKKTRVATVAVIFLVLVVSAGRQYWGFIDTLKHPTEGYNFTSEGGRIAIWERGISYMLSHPVTGVGPRNFTFAESQISPQAIAAHALGKWGASGRAPHNSFVEIGAELGVFGLAFFITMLVLAFRTLRRAGRGERDGPALPKSASALAQVLIAALTGYVVSGFFLSEAYAPILIATLGITMGLAKLKVWVPRAPSRRLGRPARPRARWHMANGEASALRSGAGR